MGFCFVLFYPCAELLSSLHCELFFSTCYDSSQQPVQWFAWVKAAKHLHLGAQSTLYSGTAGC